MHLASEWVSPVVGGTMMAVSGGAVAYSAMKLKEQGIDKKQVMLMGTAGAFVFASQMVNFAIPATGSSGHIGGGILLAALLGPYAAFLAITAVLLVQAFCFGDGGLLALGCNIFNMGVCTCFIAYPLLLKPIFKKGVSFGRLAIASVVAALVGLQLGAFGVSLETAASGINALPFIEFLSQMQPIHLAIGLIEGLATGAVLCLVHRGTPALLENRLRGRETPGETAGRTALGFASAAVVIGGGMSLLASNLPDGLEWAIQRTAAGAGGSNTGLHGILDSVQRATSFLPEYGFAGGSELMGTVVSGLAGGFITLLLLSGVGMLLHRSRR